MLESFLFVLLRASFLLTPAVTSIVVFACSFVVDRPSNKDPLACCGNSAGAIASNTWGVTTVANDIAIIGEAGTCQQEIDELLSNQRVSFRAGRAELAEASFPVLGMLASLARGCGVRLEIAAHTDAKGDSEINLRLSQRRADAVRKHLVQSGVHAEQLVAKGYGETQPLADNDTSAGRKVNRRVEFRVLGGAV